MADPDGPSDAERILVLGGLTGVALALFLGGEGAAATYERAFGLLTAWLVVLLLWWWARHR
jgi:hypothetical protein